MAKTKTIENLFVYLDVFSILVPIFFFLYYWKSSYPNSGLRILLFYCATIFLINIGLYVDPDISLLYELFTVVESVAFIGFLFLQIKSLEVKRATLIVGGAFLVFNFLYPYFFKEEKILDSVPIGVETIIVMVFSFYFLYEKTNDTSTLYIYSTPPFWVVIGMVLYLSGSFFVYLFFSYLNKEQIHRYWGLTNCFGFIKNVLFTIAIIVNSKPTKTLPSSDFEFSSLN